MKRAVVVGASALILGGCALPVPVQVASWILDGVSVLVTEKSVADHGISIVARRDCAVWRGVVDGQICRDWEGGETMVADVESKFAKFAAGNANAADAAPNIPPINDQIAESRPEFGVTPGDSREIAADVAAEDVEKLANFDTASGMAEAAVVEAGVADSVELPTLLESDFAPTPVKQTADAGGGFEVAGDAVAPDRKARSEVAVVERITKTPALVVAAPRAVLSPEAGIYFVIGSFRNHRNAKSLAGRHESFVPEVLAAKLDGAPVYRVVVGPVPEGREKSVHRRLARAGLPDTWAIRVVPGDWQMASALSGANFRRAGR